MVNMKRFPGISLLFITALGLLLTASISLASWQQSFLQDYEKQGIDRAVINALARGVDPLEIISQALTIDGLTAERITEAVCNGGVAVQAMDRALELLKIKRQTAVNICENISANLKFPGSDYLSVNKRTNYDGTGNRIRPASGHNFN